MYTLKLYEFDTEWRLYMIRNVREIVRIITNVEVQWIKNMAHISIADKQLQLEMPDGILVLSESEGERFMAIIHKLFE